MNLEPALLFHADTVQHPPTAPGVRKSIALHWWAGIFSRIWKYSVSASYNWDTVATCCPLSLWPRTGPWDADVPSTMPLSAINAEVTTVCQVSKSSCHPWRLSGVIAKFSHSFYSGVAKLPIFLHNHWSNDTGAMSCEPKQRFLCAMHLSSGSQGLLFPLYVSLKIYLLLVESSRKCTSQSELPSLLFYLYGLSDCL